MSRKYCVDCGNKVYNSYKDDNECQAAEAEAHRNPVTKDWPSCLKMRASEIFCGEMGLWYVEKKRS